MAPTYTFTVFIIGGGHWGPLETVEKIIQNRKKPKDDDSIKTENRMQNCQNRYIFTSQLLNPDRSDTVVTSGAYRVNYTNFTTGFMNTMDSAFVSSSICLN